MFIPLKPLETVTSLLPRDIVKIPSEFFQGWSIHPSEPLGVFSSSESPLVSVMDVSNGETKWSIPLEDLADIPKDQRSSYSVTSKHVSFSNFGRGLCVIGDVADSQGNHFSFLAEIIFKKDGAYRIAKIVSSYQQNKKGKLTPIKLTETDDRIQYHKFFNLIMNS